MIIDKNVHAMIALPILMEYKLIIYNYCCWSEYFWTPDFRSQQVMVKLPVWTLHVYIETLVS